MAQIKKLPTSYMATHVIGVTEGGGLRPSVYFIDGAHFTQSHRMRTNIGFHPAPAAGHRFFGNVDRSDLNAEWDRICSDPQYRSDNARQGAFSAYLATFAGQGNQDPVVRRAPNGVDTRGQTLVEVMDSGRGLKTHESRSPLQPVAIARAFQLLAGIRSRSEKIGGPDPIHQEYFFT